MNEFATENLLFMIELIHIKHAFVLKNYGVIKTIKPERLHEYVRNDHMVAQNRLNSPVVTEQSEIEMNEMNKEKESSPSMPPMHRAMSNSNSNDLPPPLCVEDIATNPSIASLPSLQPSITPAPSIDRMTMNGLQMNSSVSNDRDRQSQLDTMYESELNEKDPEQDYQVIDFNDVGSQRETVYNSMAQNYMTVHSYLFAENGQIAARIELPSGKFHLNQSETTLVPKYPRLSIFDSDCFLTCD